jgi:hypothetical protein
MTLIDHLIKSVQAAAKVNMTWDKDSGKDVVSAPWFKVFGGKRINDHHLTLAEKLAVKERKL